MSATTATHRPSACNWNRFISCDSLPGARIRSNRGSWAGVSEQPRVESRQAAISRGIVWRLAPRGLVTLAGNGAELFQDAELVEVGPVLDDLIVGDSQEVDLGPGELLAVGRDAQEVTGAGGLDVVVEDHQVAFGDDVLDVYVDVREGLAGGQHDL